MATAALSQGLGFVFWILVARLYPTAEVGIAVTLSVTLMFLANAGTLGLGFGLIRFLPGSTLAAVHTNRALTLGAGASLALGLVFLVTADAWAPGLGLVRSSFVWAVLALASATGFCLAFLIDSSFLASRRADFGTARTAVFNVVRLPLPFLLLPVSGVLAIALSWTIPLCISIFAGLGFLLRRLVPGYRFVPRISGSDGAPFVRFGLWNHAGTLLGLASSALLPLLILDGLPTGGAAQAAHFYAAQALAEVLYIVPTAFTSSLFVEGSYDARGYRQTTAQSVKTSLILLALGMVLAVLFGRVILSLFGADYEAASYLPFLFLAAGSPLVLANGILMTHLRVERRMPPLAAGTAITAVVSLGTAFVLLPSGGISGAAIGYLIGQSVGLAFFVAERELSRGRRRLRPEGY